MLRFTLSDWLAPGFSHGPDIRSPGPKQSFYVWRWYSPNGEAHEGQLVDVRRPPTTITLDVFDGAGHMASVQHTVAFSDSHVVYRWVRGVQDYYGVPMTVIYLKRVTLGKCTSARDLPLADASGRLSGDTVSLVGDKSVTTTVSCSPRAECVGSLYAARARSRARSARRRRLGARLGRAAFSMPGGTKRKVVIRLNKRGRRLAHRRQLRRIQLVLLMRAHKPQLRTVRVRRRGR
jgi:hypothetical protein